MYGKAENKTVRLILPNFKTYYKATKLRQCDIGERIHMEINGRE